MTARERERHRSAALRAVGRDPAAELRGTTLISRGRRLDVASPYLTVGGRLDGTLEAPEVTRGVADALGLLVRHSDPDLHRELRPEPPLERVMFDLLEQLRCEVAAPLLPGVEVNLDHAFEAWCRDARAQLVAESGVGLLVYTLTHMVHTRLGRGFPDEEVDGIIEATRATLAPVIGHALRELRALAHDQRLYAVPAREIARLVAEVAGDAGIDTGDARAERYRLVVPTEWGDLDGDVPEQGDLAASGIGNHDADDAMTLDELGGYHVFTREHDVERAGSSLYPAAALAELRRELDAQVAAQAVSHQRLAQVLRGLFGALDVDDWRFGQEDGVIDGRRLGQVVAGVDTRDVFRRPRPVVRSDTVIAFLMDNSGSMKTQRYEAMAVLVDTFSRALDLAGVANEVLGFTTNAWNGGRALQEWRAAGSPADPGRMGEALHIVYKDADTPWRRARQGIASLMRPRHFREGFDGEAVAWAHRRLLARPERRKLLVMISDGAPMDAATSNTNSPGFLDRHLVRVVDHIERRSPVVLGAMTLDRDVGAVFGRSTHVDLDGTLTIGTYAALHHLFGRE